jgi:hypothetical protein
MPAISRRTSSNIQHRSIQHDEVLYNIHTHPKPSPTTQNHSFRPPARPSHQRPPEYRVVAVHLDYSCFNMSFLDLNNSARPISCIDAAAAPTPSSSASSSMSKSIRALLSGGNSSNNYNNNTSSSTSVNQIGDSILDTSEFHLLTILSGIDKLSLERDTVETARLASMQLISKGMTGKKRNTPCSSDEDRLDIGMEDDLQILREIREMVEVVMERRKLVPVSQVRRWTEFKWEMDRRGKTKPVSAWGKVWGRLHSVGEGGKKKCWEAFGRLAVGRR